LVNFVTIKEHMSWHVQPSAANILWHFQVHTCMTPSFNWAIEI